MEIVQILVRRFVRKTAHSDEPSVSFKYCRAPPKKKRIVFLHAESDES
jgi:hypothetical protein